VILDIRTLYVVTAMSCLVLGALQRVAYGTQRFKRWPAWWGLSNVLLGLGTLGVAIAERIRVAFAKATGLLGALVIQPTLSIGIATGSLTDDTLDTILQRADEALYRSKREGRNRVRIAALEYHSK
jgi:hypothetical protein